ncbi:hypothetical protein fh0823_27820 (plasmid) [Francisella halioticida]|uniref:Tom37 metaxin N-terminal-like domain-containing protein n=1 Tax=Francisella halioticida TaxID=549298 RepID=UPI001AF2FE28|nr:Tom37 metaxin N-terminal-like domain-containing protein [Francisella halioticida]BCD92645.1 hypothetical protein fh0823_27820 [Francisella halioticida]
MVLFKVNKIEHEIIYTVDTSNAPRNQLPYIEDDGKKIGDSFDIINYVINKYKLPHYIRYSDILIERTLDHLYWAISYSRWGDPDNYSKFSKHFHEATGLEYSVISNIRDYNIEKLKYQGIGREDKDRIYRQVSHDINALCMAITGKKNMSGDKYNAIDSSCYGFLATIYYSKIKTPMQEAFIYTRLPEYIKLLKRLADK